jgi:hypothetical protein
MSHTQEGCDSSLNTRCIFKITVRKMFNNNNNNNNNNMKQNENKNYDRKLKGTKPAKSGP